MTPDAAPISRRSFFKASGAKLLWNTGATAVMALTHSDVDKTNQSYYGESGLHFLACDASFEGSVPLREPRRPPIPPLPTWHERVSVVRREGRPCARRAVVPTGQRVCGCGWM